MYLSKEDTQALIAALENSRKYVEDCYEAAFPNEDKNAQVIADIDKSLVLLKANPKK